VFPGSIRLGNTETESRDDTKSIRSLEEKKGRDNVRGFVLGVFLTIFMILVGGFLFVRSGRLSMATTAPPLPLEGTVAELAIRASIGNAKDQTNPLPFGEANMMAGAKLYKDHCAGCHGDPRSRSTIAKAMFPAPPQLFEKDDMVIDDPEGETYWKVSHGIRLSGMPGFGGILSDTERWQVTMLVAHADKLPTAAQAVFGY
jgi:mono/diheme cytochrome c family protein